MFSIAWHTVPSGHSQVPFEISKLKHSKNISRKYFQINLICLANLNKSILMKRMNGFSGKISEKIS